MKKSEELMKKIGDLIKDTQAGKISWEVQCQTTEYDDASTKQIERDDDGTEWVVDECYVSYYCENKGEDFLMISYEKLYKNGDQVHSKNLVFTPPLGVRFFDVARLAEYAVDTDKMLAYNVHMLWITLMDLYKSAPDRIALSVSGRE
ncbi:MAG: hypothetical protein LUI02_02950 [Clostridiales bacterium]|nr:hypothetical protein [Clostridiales bacterium]